MSMYRVIRIAGGIGYKVHVTNASAGMRVIGIFPSEADATDWIAVDQQVQPTITSRPPDRVREVMLDNR